MSEGAPVLKQEGGGLDPSVVGEPEPAKESPPAISVVPAGPTKWPSEAITMETAEAALCAGQAPAGLEGLSGQLLGSLNEIETGALWSDGSDPALMTLKTAVLARWWMSALLATRPAGEPIDLQALEKVLARIDEILTAVVTPEGADEATAAAYAQARGSLAKDAVVLSEIAASATKKEAEATAEQTVAKKYEHLPRVRTYDDSKDRAATSGDKRQRALLIGFAATLVATIAFHTAMFWPQTPPPVASSQRAAPEGIDAQQETAGGHELFMVADPAKATPTAVEKYKAEMTAAGKQVIEVGPGMFVAHPQEEQSP